MALTTGVAAFVGGPTFHVGHSHAHAASLAGIHKIRHVVVVMQENRSFDSYFGTYPGADGLPRQNGRFTVCVPDPRSGICQRPYHDRLNRNTGGPHEHFDAIRDIDGGKMDGFLRQARRGLAPSCLASSDAPICSFGALRPDVMGYHDAREIPNYWTYARRFVRRRGRLSSCRCTRASPNLGGWPRPSRRTRSSSSRSTRSPTAGTASHA